MRQRVFLAFPLPQGIRSHLAGVADALARGLDMDEVVRWVGPDGMHVTAHFLGDQDEDAVRRVSEAAGDVASRYPAVPVRLGPVDAFPPGGDPRVIVAQVLGDDSRSLTRLQAELGRLLERQGIDVDHRPWSPHVTLGRVKTRIAVRKLAVPIEPLPFRVDSLELIRSRLADDGSLYEPLAAFPLSA